jgi:hypothetical protein
MNQDRAKCRRPQPPTPACDAGPSRPACPLCPCPGRLCGACPGPGRTPVAFAKEIRRLRAEVADLWTRALAIFEAIEDPNAETVRRWLAQLDP